MLFFFNIKKIDKISIQISLSGGVSDKNQKFWVGGEYKIQLKTIPNIKDQKILYKIQDSTKAELLKDRLLLKSSGKECITAYIKKYYSTICFNIYNTPKLMFKEKNPIKVETNFSKNLNLDTNDYPESNIIYKSNHPDIINVNAQGKITVIRPGNAVITASGFDNISAKIKVIGISNNGLISNYTLDQMNVSHYKNVMIVAHPDDETLWGGANLLKENYFVVCLTNGYNIERANDFRNILNFTKNGGIILNYPDSQDFQKDNWILVKKGILKDLSTILNYKSWEKIVTHGPDGTGGHYHHIKTFQYVTLVAQKYNKYNNLFYFAKYYKKNEIPNYLPRISDDELKYKIKEVSLYKTKRNLIYKLWFHMLPFENLISASKWTKFEKNQ